MTKYPFAPLALMVLALAACPTALGAQTSAPATPGPLPAAAPASMPPREPLPAPPGIRPFAVPQELVGRELGLEEAVNIALENAPLIVARIGDYLAAQQRVNQALAPLLPQLTGSGSYGVNVSSESVVEVEGRETVTALTVAIDAVVVCAE